MKPKNSFVLPRRSIRPETFGFTIVLGLLGALPPLAIDISSPTLLMVEQQLSTSTSMVGLIITLFMVGFAFGQLTGGPLSDRYGRRPVLLLGLTSYTAAAIGCSLAGSIGMLLTWRLAQGVGAGACAVLTFAMIRDLFEGDQARVKRSYITVVFGIAPMLAPLLGAWILAELGWRPVYLALALGGSGLLAAVVFGVAESRVPVAGEVRAPLLGSYWAVLRQPRFVGLVAVNALSFGGVFSYIAGSPLVLMGNLALTPAQYGQVFASTAAVLTLGAWVSGRCAQRGVPCRNLLWTGLGLGAVSAVVLAGLFALGVSHVGLLLGPLLVNLFSRGLTSPNLQHLALEPMREQAGTAAATLGVIQILSGAAASAVVATLLPVFGGMAMASAMAVLGSGALLLWSLVHSRPG